MQHLEESDIESCIEFARRMMDHLEIANKMWFSDESHFYLNNIVNNEEYCCTIGKFITRVKSVDGVGKCCLLAFTFIRLQAAYFLCLATLFLTMLLPMSLIMCSNEPLFRVDACNCCLHISMHRGSFLCEHRPDVERRLL